MGLLGNTGSTDSLALQYLQAAPPTASDDATQGYTIGAHWTDTNTQRVYICVSNAVGAAVWKEAGVAVPPPPPPGGVTYPASYFTGPLGVNNILPTEDGAFLMTWCIAPQAEGTAWTAHQAQIAQREAEMGRLYDGIMMTDFQFEWAENHLTWIHNRGCIPLVAGLHFDTTLDVILSGAVDSQINAYADHWKNLGFNIMVRMFHEMSLGHLGYTCVGQPAKFIQTWRKIIDMFDARGATNVGFWWCPTEGDNRADVDAAYPGDAYVDWVGTDSYNWVFVNETGNFAWPGGGGWASFGQIFNYGTNIHGFPPVTSRHDTYGPRKPFMIGETGTVYDANFPTFKGQWFRDIPAAGAAMPYLRGVSFFDVNAAEHGEAARNNWLVDHPISNPDVIDGYHDMAQDPYFNTRT